MNMSTLSCQGHFRKPEAGLAIPPLAAPAPSSEAGAPADPASAGKEKGHGDEHSCHQRPSPGERTSHAGPTRP